METHPVALFAAPTSAERDRSMTDLTKLRDELRGLRRSLHASY
jgi:hypothetical protein